MPPLEHIARSLARIAARIVMLPIRFVAWVYQADARRRPGRGELQTHRHAAQLGVDTAEWTEVEQSLHDREALARRTTHDADTPPKDT